MGAPGRGRRGREHLGPGLRAAGERDHAHPVVADQGCAHRVAAAGQDVDHAGGVDSGQDLGQRQRGERRLLRRLEHHRVAGRQRRGELPGRHHQGVVPRRHLGHDPHRVAPDHAGQPRQVLAGGHARHAARGTGEEAEAVDDRRHLVAQGPGRGLAGVAGFQLQPGPPPASRSRRRPARASASAPAAWFVPRPERRRRRRRQRSRSATARPPAPRRCGHRWPDRGSSRPDPHRRRSGR